MNKTIYIKDEDLPIWDRAKELAGDKLAPVIVEGLKQFIAEKEAEAAEAAGFTRIILAYNDYENHGLPRKIAFTGKWVFPPEKPLSYKYSGQPLRYYAVALTPKEGILLYSWYADPQHQRVEQRVRTAESLELLASHAEFNPIALKILERIGIPVEELDI